MEKSDGEKKQETVTIRISEDLYRRILAAKEPAFFGDVSDEDFMRYLIGIGLNDTEIGIKEGEIIDSAVPKKAKHGKGGK